MPVINVNTVNETNTLWLPTDVSIVDEPVKWKIVFWDQGSNRSDSVKTHYSHQKRQQQHTHTHTAFIGIHTSNTHTHTDKIDLRIVEHAYICLFRNALTLFTWCRIVCRSLIIRSIDAQKANEIRLIGGHGVKYSRWIEASASIVLRAQHESTGVWSAINP